MGKGQKYIIAAYRDLCGIEAAALKIGNGIGKIYESV